MSFHSQVMNLGDEHGHLAKTGQLDWLTRVGVTPMGAADYVRDVIELAMVMTLTDSRSERGRAENQLRHRLAQLRREVEG